MEMSRAEKLRQAGIKKFGSLEAYTESLRERGRKGGISPKSTPSGFAAMTPDKRRKAALKGLKSRWHGEKTQL